MKKRYPGIRGTLLLSGMLLLAAASTLDAATTFTFRNGVNSYSGGGDVSINTQYAQYNGGNGWLWKGPSQMGCYSTTGTDPYNVRYILKFGNLAVPAGSQVVSATLTLAVEYWNAGGNITGWYLKNAWDPASSRIGWIHRNATADWAGPGASVAGTDTVAGKSFQLPALRAVGQQTVNMALDPAVVQSWLDIPAANQGILLVNNKPGDILNITGTAGTQNQRPMLTIVVNSGTPAVSVSISPTSASLQAGQTQQFTASVAGTTNTAVTWTATGGTISSTGLFTAGSTAGSFTVTARSAADATKSATATVTVNSVVSVSVSPTAATLAPGQTRQFTASVTGTANTAVAWSATGGTISATGLFTAGSTAGSFSVTAKSAADTTKSASASVSISSTSNLPPIPRQSDGSYIRVQTPVSGMHFTAPATIRMYADPSDVNAPDQDAFTVDFLLNGQSAGTFTGDSAHNGYWALTVNNVPAGTYAITTQFVDSNNKTVTSPPVTVFVDAPALSSGPVFNLNADVVLTGSQAVAYVGTPANHCAINGNGFQIRSSGTFTGSLNIVNCDVRGLGSTTTPAIDVTVSSSGSVNLNGNVFDTFGTVAIGAAGQAQVAVRNNEFRENTLVPVTSLPTEYAGQTLPVFRGSGNSSAQKFFQGNNVGLSTVVFENTNNWLIGGNTDAESNIMMGVRCGFTISGSTGMVLRGNYSQHNYPHRMSQGDNFQLDGDGFLAEHNVIRNSSWPVRGMGGELRYNLIDTGGNADQVVQGVLPGIRIHHNIFSFTVSQTLYGPGTGISIIYQADNVQFYNNVMDGGGTVMQFAGVPVSVGTGSFISSLRNNVFYNFASQIGTPSLAGGLGEPTNPPLQRLRYSDYNDFYNPNADNQTNYGLGVIGLNPGAAGYGMHDLGGFNGHANPKFTQPTVLPFPFAPEEIWSRTKKVSDVLASYRAMYSPAAGSPLTGAGDPQDGAGGNIGAVGNGEPADQFGKFGTGVATPVKPVISGFTATPANPQAGQSVTLNWSVMGADTLSIAPGVGTVSGTSVSVTPTSTTTYTLTAANAGGSVTATTTVTVGVVNPVTISVSPTSASVVVNTTKQFTATVGGTTNTAVTWSAAGGTISPGGLFTAGATAGSFKVTATSAQDTTKSASASVNIVTATTSSHPRIILDTPTLTALRSRAQSRTATWTALQSVCDSFLGGGTVNFPGENGYPNLPSVGEGYQGSGYADSVLPLGLCYQVTRLSDPTKAAQYASKGVAILMAMSDPGHTIVDGSPVWDRDSGYGIRNFGFAMGVGYDWLHDVMTPAQLAQLQTSLNNWIAGFENDSFEYDHPQGNYFAGYYVSKCMAALAVQGDAPLGDTWWNDWYNHQHLQRVAPYYNANLAGGGWTEGFMQYGVLGVRNQALPALAVKTALGLDIIHAPVPYAYPLETGRYVMHFTWPTHNMTDDRGELYNTEDATIWPGTPRLETYRFLAGYLAMWNDPSAPMLHKYARDVKTALAALNAADSTEWVDFIFWDEAAPETVDYSSLPMSYVAPGMGAVFARSDWSATATFLSFMSGPYINNPAAGHEAFDKGSLAIEKNKSPLLVNPDAWITHEPNGSAGWNVTFDDRYGNWDIDHTLGNRTLYNTFQVRHLDSQGGVLDNYGEEALQRDDGVRTKIGRYEDGGSYVLAVGQFLEDMYRPFQTICPGVPPISSWSRQILYLRPSQFVVYDRTGICNSSLDQYLAFHFPAAPVEVAAPATGLHRFDITNGQFAGSMTVVQPANARFATTDRFSTDTSTWNKLWRTEIRPTDAATSARRWLTVFDAAGSPAQVAAATPINVASGAATGVLLQSAAGNSAAVFGTAPVGTAIAGTLAYTVPAAQTRHVITDVVPSTGYNVVVTVSGTNHVVTVTAGGSMQSTANGVLAFGVSGGGALQP